MQKKLGLIIEFITLFKLEFMPLNYASHARITTEKCPAESSRKYFVLKTSINLESLTQTRNHPYKIKCEKSYLA
jgi:hypothetical protein